MDEPELHVRDLTPRYGPACESGRHLVHPFLECDEIDVLGAAFNEMIERVYAEAFAAAQAGVDQLLLHGNGTGEPRGFPSANRISIPYALSDAEMADHGVIVGEPESTPVERALAILDPHLRDCPLYDAGPPAIYPTNRKA